MIKLIERCKRLLVLGLGACLFLASIQAGAEDLFDHGKTGFELSGSHKFISCDSCHINGQFKGTSPTCVSCHSTNGRVNATSKPVNHINTSNRCESCHNVAVWNSVPRVDHNEVFGACVMCHNPNIVPGKPANHIPTTNECTECHSDMSWLPTHFTHDAITAPCASCHNGTRPTITGKPLDHPNASDNCAACHQPKMWKPPVTVDHDEVRGTCASCHDIGGRFAIKPADHIPISGDCAACHTPTVWNPPQRVDHDFVLGTCAGCHDTGARFAAPKPPDFGRIRHSIFGTSCGSCHRVAPSWPLLPFDHDNIQLLGNNCKTCHDQDRSQCGFHQMGGFKVDECSGCHFNTMVWGSRALCM